MAISVKLSTGLRNHIASVGSAMSALQNGFIDLYGGVEPATADADATAATKLLRFSLNGSGTGLPLVSPTPGVFGKDGAADWQGLGLAAADATWFRHVAAADDGALSTTQPRVQGNVALTDAAITLVDVAVQVGATVVLNTYTVTVPANN